MVRRSQIIAISAVGLVILALAAMPDPLAAAEQGRIELLWPGGAPGAKGDAPDDKPTLTVFLPEPEKANGDDLARARELK